MGKASAAGGRSAAGAGCGGAEGGPKGAWLGLRDHYCKFYFTQHFT